MKFSEIVKSNFPQRNIIITVGDTTIFMGNKSCGLEEMSKQQIEWLDNHKPKHIYYSMKEIEFIYQKSKKYEEIVWGANSKYLYS